MIFVLLDSKESDDGIHELSDEICSLISSCTTYSC